jgi:hypothetical protein
VEFAVPTLTDREDSKEVKFERQHIEEYGETKAGKVWSFAAQHPIPVESGQSSTNFASQVSIVLIMKIS